MLDNKEISMEDDIINEVVDQHYADAPLIDTNPETTETYKEEEEYGYETKESSLRFIRRW